ncbi:MAG TPA: hypothetical protein VJ925_10495, partial [Longimicrobiales bacterium]|nr:hypothetical protein [Longimicrobiales bacterium]
MTLPRTIHQVFEAEAGPAMRLGDLNARVREFGAACTPAALRRQLQDDPDGLRTVGAGDAVLRSVTETCPARRRPIGADEVVIDGGARGIRPTPADAVRVLA